MSSSRSIVVGAFVAAIGGSFLAIACTSEVEQPHYGPPSGLTGKSPTTVTADGAAPAPTSTGTGNPGTGSALCNGQGPIDGGACAVSFANKIYPQMLTTGNWKCADAACHGKKVGGTPPFIDPSGATAAWTGLVATPLVSNGGKPYFNPCSTDPTTSSFSCNTSGACGAGMPLTTAGAKAPTAQEAADILTWVKCGSPNN